MVLSDIIVFIATADLIFTLKLNGVLINQQKIGNYLP